MDDELQKRIEAVLFSLGRKVNVKDIMRMTKQRDSGIVIAALIELKNKYNSDEKNSLMILQDGDDWKLTIKDQYTDVAKSIGITTELPKTIIETLAVIAYKNPVMQSDVIKVRTNKAYDHLSELEKLGYITREKKGRSKLLKLAPKFFEYFDVPPDALKSFFAIVAAMEQKIVDTEQRIHDVHAEKQEKIKLQREEEKELEKHNIYLEGIPSMTPQGVSETVVSDPHGLTIISGEKLGNLDVYADSVEEKITNTSSSVSTMEQFDLHDTNAEKAELSSFKESLANSIKSTDSTNKQDSSLTNDSSSEMLSSDMKDFDSKDLDSPSSFKTDSPKDSFDSDLSSDSSSSNKLPDLAKQLADSIEKLMQKKNEVNSQDLGSSRSSQDASKDSTNSDIDTSKPDSLSSKQNLDETTGADSLDAVDSNRDISSSSLYASSDDTENDSPSKLKEMDIFSMKGLSKETMTKIEDRANEVLGIKEKKKDTSSASDNSSSLL